MGVSTKTDLALRQKRKAAIIRLHAKGWSDSEVADAIGIPRRAVGSYRERLNLPANGRNERYRKRVAENTKRQLKAAGVSSLAEIKALEVAKLAKALGWPEHLSLRSIQIAESLYQRGPMTRKQIANAIGIEWRGSRKTFSGRMPGGSCLAELQRSGLVVRLQSAITHGGKGNHEDVYFLGLEIEPCQANRSKSQLRRLKLP